MNMNDREPVNLRCSALIVRTDSVLACARPDGTWVLPGGTPRHGEGAAACVLREVQEETGLLVNPGRVAFVLEATNLDRDQHLIEIVFTASVVDADPQLLTREAHLRPAWLPLNDLAQVRLRPPIAGHLRGLHSTGYRSTAAYLGNVWRPEPSTALDVEEADR
jgi:8-oxo-dGTP diphosphatase